ncbi:MAG: preprotein translocase subunit SecG [Acidobacteria bacterium]|nr:preprotein translocase subunit SecG [Acidobacteriota bacterium]MCW5950595.1 preprotein translocase subunit SecG [Pyrinomonadaceae bacterium]
MVYLLYGIFFLSCVVLVIAVLLQPGKTDAGALFTSNISSSAFAPRGTATILAKITISAAVIFMVSALLLSMPALNGNVSVLSSNPETIESSETAPTANTEPAPAANNDAAPSSAPAGEQPAANK